MMPQLDERISTLETKLKQLKAKQVRLEARRRALASKQQRKDDTRRKILLGAVVLGRVEAGEMTQVQLNQWLDKALTRPDDRALFELAVR